jgi:hypothetical protein
MADYKGIYYNNDSSEKYFEGGAHFRYKQLYKILEKLSSAQKMRLKREKLIKSRETKAKDKIKKTKKLPDKNGKNAENNIHNSNINANVSHFIVL